MSMTFEPNVVGSTCRTSTPWLSVRNGARAVEFYKSAFGANETYHVGNPAGEVVSRLSVDGAEFWLSDESPEHNNFSPESLGGGSVKMLLIVPDPDSMFAKAVAAGTRLGRYEIRAKIGEGGMGEVYRARDTKLNRDVAIKVAGSTLAR
jgi:PhnB protein